MPKQLLLESNGIFVTSDSLLDNGSGGTKNMAILRQYEKAKYNTRFNRARANLAKTHDCWTCTYLAEGECNPLNGCRKDKHE